MRFSEHWLRTLVDPPLDSAALCDCLTMAGLEVEETAPAAPPFSGGVVARILDVEPHPNADKLRVCRVDAGQATPLHIVCGAPNAAAGLVVPCALEGAVLPGGFNIKRTTMRGVESRGMLCSARELGISDDHSGLMPLPADLTPGADIRAALHLDDTFITLKLTPNRADCLSLVGVAREVAALTGTPLRLPERVSVRLDSKAVPGIRLEAPDACPRFAARIIENVNPQAPTPLWMQQRLLSAGIRPISALVDVTNYVMMELGQPMHAYDCRQIDGDIVVRFAQPGEKLLLLNEQTLDLAPDLLMVCDEKKPLGLAGIMGGEHTGIAPDTTNVFLEAAHFSPTVIQGKMRRLGFVSDAGHRFERGVDFELPPKAIERATEWIVAICGIPGKTMAGPLVDERKTLPTRPPVRVRTARVSRILGWSFDADAVAVIFQKLGFAFTRDGDDFTVTPPSYRFDLTLEEDFIEEVARIHGYDNIPLPTISHGQHMLALPETQLPVATIKQRLAHQGWQEILTFSFVSSEMERLLNGETPNIPPVRVHNPIAAQLDVMRTSLLPGLLETLKSNLNRKEPYLRLFEVGRIFLSATADAAAQPYRIGGLAYGDAVPEQWGSASTRRPVDFFDVKGTLEALAAPRRLTTAPFAHADDLPLALHPRRAACVLLDGVTVGWLGELHPRLVGHLEFPKAPVVFELDQEALCERIVPLAQPISRQPIARRDLAVVVDANVPAQALVGSLEKVRLDSQLHHVEDIQLFDVYQGSNLPAGKKSVAILMLMRDTQRTLTDRDIDTTLQIFYAALEKDHGARLRS
jgi:phenylalanyl-tRNA synthetase beta chain